MPDYSIPLQTRLPASRSPIQTIGALAQLDSYQDQAEGRRLMNEQRRRLLEDDEAIRSTLQRVERPDDAVEDLYNQGRASAAGALGKQLLEHRTAQSKALAEQLTATQNKLKMASQIAQGMKDQNTFGSGKKAITALLGPELANELGEWDAEAPKRVEMAIAWGTERAQFITAQQNAVQNAQKAWEFGLAPAADGVTWSKAKVERDEAWRQSASSLLSTARKPEEWEGYQRLLYGQGAPKEILAQFGAWDPEAPARALKLGQKPHEQATSASQAATRVETARHNRVVEGQGAQGLTLRKQEMEKASSGSTLTANAKSAAERWRANTYEKFRVDNEFELEELTKMRSALESTSDKDREKDPNKRKQLSDRIAAIQQKHAALKLEIQDNYRSQLGLPPLLEAERQTYLTGDKAGRAEIRKLYGELTEGQKTQLQQVEARAKELVERIKTERNPEAAAALQKELRELRDQYFSGR